MILLMMNRVYTQLQLTPLPFLLMKTQLRTVMATSKLEKLVISFSRVTQWDGSKVRTRSS